MDNQNKNIYKHIKWNILISISYNYIKQLKIIQIIKLAWVTRIGCNKVLWKYMSWCKHNQFETLWVKI